MAEYYDRSLFIFRRDLRVQDNTALIKCMRKSKQILCCFIFDPRQVTTQNSYKSNNAIQFMVESLHDLNFQLKKKLNFYYGLPNVIVQKLIKRYGIDAIWCNMDYTLFSKRRDKTIQKIAQKNGIKFLQCEDILLNPILKEGICTKSGKFYEKFTPFYMNAKRRRICRPQRVNTTRLAKKCVADQKKFQFRGVNKLFKKNPNISVKGGRQEAKRLIIKLQSKKTALHGYAVNRNRLTFRTTRLSAHNKFGTVSIREVYHAIKSSRGLSKTDKQILHRQLYWRDFYTYVIWHSPNSFKNEHQVRYRKLKWVGISSKLGQKYWDAWKRGKTGYPIVDANMRMLNKTGYMHNRGRMIVANFLVRDLAINWRHGERYFAKKLVDYDPIQNNQGWQFTASTGASAQEWFRVMNPWTQQQKFDPDSKFVRTWLHEFTKIPEFIIYDWQKCYPKYHKKIKYPAPIVNHDQARVRTLAIYRKVFSK